MNDVIARIDELAAEEKCPHCDREWHELALTQQVAHMFESGHLSADYFSREDKSPIVCDGSAFIGPLRPEPPGFGAGWTTSTGSFTWTGSISFNAWVPDDTQWATLTISPANQLLTFPSWDLGINSSAPWVTWHEPEPPKCDPVPDGIEMEFGPQNWLPPEEPVHVSPDVVKSVSYYLNEFAAVETHTPEPKGI